MIPSRYARLLKNPNTRAAVPDRFLPKALLRKRLLNRSLDAPILPGADITRRTLAHNREAATGLRYGDVDRSLQGRLAQNAQAQTQHAGWFDQYLAQVRDIEGRQQTQQAQAMQQIQGLGNAGASNQQQLAGFLQQQGVNPAQAAQTDANASAIRNALTNSFGAMLASQGASGGDFLRTQELAGGQAKLEHLSDLLKQRGKIDEDIKAVAKEKGQFRTTYEQDQKDAARKRILENQAFGLDTAKAGNTARDQAQRRIETRRHNRSSEQATKDAKLLKVADFAAKYGKKPDEWLGMTPEQRRSWIKTYKPPKGAKGGSDGPDWQRSSQVGTLRTAVSHTRVNAEKLRDGWTFVVESDGTGKWKRGKVPKTRTRPEVLRLIQADPKAPDPLAIKVALDMAYYGKLTPVTVRQLIRAGIKPSVLGYPTQGGGV